MFQIPDRQHGPHNRREQRQHAVRIRPSEHRVSRIRAGDARVGRRKVYHLQRECILLLLDAIFSIIKCTVGNRALAIRNETSGRRRRLGTADWARGLVDARTAGRGLILDRVYAVPMWK